MIFVLMCRLYLSASTTSQKLISRNKDWRQTRQAKLQRHQPPKNNGEVPCAARQVVDVIDNELA